MVDWVADRAGTKLVAQIDAAAPGRRKDSDGTIGDPAHQARDSAHNPEDSADADAPGNPDEQVDAFDVTHDPAHGCDIGVFWENVRASHDRRAKFAIFNRRCFSNYAVTGYAAFTWRPYIGENPHDKHGHIEIDDRYHDQTHDWQIGSGEDMDIADKWVARVASYRIEAMLSMREVVNVPALGTYKAFSEPNVLAVTLRAQADPDVDETKIAALLAPTIRDIFADMDNDNPTDGLTEEEVIAAIGEAFSRARFNLEPQP